MPQRALEAGGLSGGWGTIAQMYVPFLLLIPISIWRKWRGQSFGLDYPFIGLLMGGGIAFYANSFLLTDVVRALILFYMTPVWATLFEFLFLKRRPTWHRGVSILLALSGVWIVFSSDFIFPFPQNIGDWVALIGGIVLAGGAVRTDIIKPDSIFSVLLSFFFYGGLVTLIQAFFLKDALGPLPSIDAWVAMMPWLLLISVVFLIPTNIVILGSPNRIGAGLFSIIILFEIVVGTVSSAFLTNETFGWREGIGGSLILLAGLAEIILSPKNKIE